MPSMREALLTPREPVASSPCIVHVFAAATRRNVDRYMIVQGGLLDGLKPPAIPNVRHNLINASGRLGIGTLGDERWLVGAVHFEHPLHPHGPSFAEHDPDLHIAWIDQASQVVVRFDDRGARVRFSMSRVMTTTLQDIAGLPQTDGAWFYRLMWPRTNIASVRLIRQTHLHLFIPE